MAFFKLAVYISCILATVCSLVMSQAPSAGTDPALFANLFMSSPQSDPTSSGFAPSTGGNSAPSPMFPTLGGASTMPAMPQPRPNPLSSLMKMMFFRKMDMGNWWPLMALGGMGGGSGGGAGGLFSSPILMLSMMNNM